MKRKFISPKEREKWNIIQSKEIIKKLLWNLHFNNDLLEFYDQIQDKQLLENRKRNIRFLILENLEFYKELKSEKNLLKNILKKKILKISQKIEKKENISFDEDNYDNLAIDNAREQKQNEGWNNYLHNFSK